MKKIILGSAIVCIYALRFSTVANADLICDSPHSCTPYGHSGGCGVLGSGCSGGKTCQTSGNCIQCCTYCNNSCAGLCGGKTNDCGNSCNSPCAAPTNTPRPAVPTHTPRPNAPTNTPPPATAPPLPTDTPDPNDSCPGGTWTGNYNPDGSPNCSNGGHLDPCKEGTCHVLTPNSGCGADALMKICTGGAIGYACQNDLARVICSGGNYCDTFTPNKNPVPWVDATLDLTRPKKVKGKEVPDPQGVVSWGELSGIPQYYVEIYDLTNPSLTVDGFPKTHNTWVPKIAKNGNNYSLKQAFHEKWSVIQDKVGHDAVNNIDIYSPHVYKVSITAIDSCGHNDPPPVVTTTLKSFIQGNVYNCPAGTQVTVAGVGTYPNLGNGSGGPAPGSTLFYSTGAVLAGGKTYDVTLSGASGFDIYNNTCFNCTNHPLPNTSNFSLGTAMQVTPPSRPAAGRTDSYSYVDAAWFCSPHVPGATAPPGATATVPPGATATPTTPPAATPTPIPGLYLNLTSVVGITKTDEHLISVDKKQYDFDVPMTLTNNGIDLSGVTVTQIGNNGAPDTYTTISLPTVPTNLIPGESVSITAHLTAVVNVGASGTFGIKFKASGHDSAVPTPNSVSSLYAPVNQTLDGPSIAWVQMADSSYYHPAPNPVSVLRNPIPNTGGSISIDGWPLSYPPQFNYGSGKTGLSTVNSGAGTIDFTPKTPESVLSPWKDGYTRSEGHTVDSYIGKIIASGKAQKVSSASDIRFSGLYLINSDIELDTFDRPNTSIVIVVNGNVTIKSTGGGGGVFGSPGSSLAILAKGITIDDSVLRAYGFLWSTSITSKFTSNTLLVKGNLISDTGWSEVPRNADSAAPTMLIEFDPLSYMKLNQYLGAIRVESR